MSNERVGFSKKDQKSGGFDLERLFGGDFSSLSGNGGGMGNLLSNLFDLISKVASDFFTSLFGGKGLGSSGGGASTKSKTRFSDLKRYVPTDARPGTYDFAFAHILEAEGGFANNPHDRGGKTIYGITRKNFPKTYDQIMALRAAGKEAESIQVAYDFYKREFYDPSVAKVTASGIQPNWKTNLVAFDSAVNSGLGVVDGLLKETGGNPDKMIASRRGFYSDLARKDRTQRTFLKGWNDRMDSLQKTINADYPDEVLDPNAETGLDASKDLITDLNGELIHPERYLELLNDKDYAQRHIEKYLPKLNELKNGYEIKFIQTALTKLDYKPGEADGKIGAKTRAAAQAYIKDQNTGADHDLETKVLQGPQEEQAKRLKETLIETTSAPVETMTYRDSFLTEALLSAADPSAIVTGDGIIDDQEKEAIQNLRDAWAAEKKAAEEAAATAKAEDDTTAVTREKGQPQIIEEARIDQIEITQAPPKAKIVGEPGKPLELGNTQQQKNSSSPPF